MISCRRNIVIIVLIFASLLSCQSHISLAQSNNGGGGSSSVQASADVNSKGTSGNSQAVGSVSGSGGSLSTSANAAVGSSTGASGGSSSSANGSQSSPNASSGSASASASLSTSSASQGSSTPKSEGILGRIKGAVKSGVDSLTSSKKDDNNQQQQPQQQHQVSASLGSGDNQGQSNSGTGLVEKLGDATKKAKDLVKDGAKEVIDDVKTVMGVNKANSKSNDDKNGNNNGNSYGNGGASGTGGFSVGGSVKIGDSSVGGNMQIGGSSKAEANTNVGNGKSDSPNDKSESSLSKLVHKVEEKASGIANKLGGGSGDKGNNGNLGGSATASAQVKVNSNGGGANGSASATTSVNAPNGEDKSLAVGLADKMHEIAKAPVEAVMKPIDKALGLEKDPLIQIYDESHQLIRKPLSIVAKPVESVLSGAFKTSEEAKQEQERVMSEQERRDMKMKEERARQEGRSVLGEIADKTVDFVEKPYEFALKPVDKMLGFDKEGQKDPLIKLFEEIYNISKKPIDIVAKPLENILKKMAEGDQAYQVSMRINSGAGDSPDPKLITRLADGALNIADRVFTKSLEVAMRPLGYDGLKNKNPIVDSTHQLKNATKLGLELLTRPVDRIIKEISDIGSPKSAAEREAERERRRLEASRLVKLLDKLNQAAQTPWEIVLRPISRVFGYGKEGKREPFLRAWDIIHQVVRTPIQVVSKPIEDAILGEQKQSQRPSFKADVKIGSKTGVNGQVQIGAGAGTVGSSASASIGQEKEEQKKNIFVDGIKRIEKIAVRPFNKFTSPIRRLILGEDDKVGSGIKAKASVNTPDGKVQAKAQVGGSISGEPDKLVKTLENINNVMLKPLEAVSQPISDLISSEGKDKTNNETKAQAQVQINGSQGQKNAAASASTQINNNNGKSGSSNGNQMNMSASASTQTKANINGNNNNNGGGSNNNSGSSDYGQTKVAASAQIKKN